MILAAALRALTLLGECSGNSDAYAYDSLHNLDIFTSVPCTIACIKGQDSEIMQGVQQSAHRMVLFWRLANVQKRCLWGSMPSSFATSSRNSPKVFPFLTLSCLTCSAQECRT